MLHFPFLILNFAAATRHAANEAAAQKTRMPVKSLAMFQTGLYHFPFQGGN